MNDETAPIAPLKDPPSEDNGYPPEGEGAGEWLSVNGAAEFLSLHLDPEFLKEDAKLVSDTLLGAIQEAAKKAKEQNDAEMQKVTGGLQLPPGMKLPF